METDVLVVGAGSSGFGAAYRALKAGCRVVLLDPMPGPGGTSVFAGVNCWEPGIGGDGIHREIARRLIASGDGFVGKTVSFVSDSQRFAVSDRANDPYESTLCRHGLPETAFRRFHFEPDAMTRVMRDLLREAGGDRLIGLFLCRAAGVKTEGGAITEVRYRDAAGALHAVRARVVIDATGDIAVARAAGCRASLGDDEGNLSLNGITQCFRIRPSRPGEPEETFPVPAGIRAEAILREYREQNGPVACFNVYPRGGISVNMLPTAPGVSMLEQTADALRDLCRARAVLWWQWVKEHCRLSDWRIDTVFPMIGIREGWRLAGEYVLTEEDLLRGFAPGPGLRRTAAFADHPADIHGENGCLLPTGKYAIPYDCLLPREIGNLLVACRGASFTHRASSSARLSRTMLALGETAGRAAAYCVQNGISPRDLPTDVLATWNGIG